MWKKAMAPIEHYAYDERKRQQGTIWAIGKKALKRNSIRKIPLNSKAYFWKVHKVRQFIAYEPPNYIAMVSEKFVYAVYVNVCIRARRRRRQMLYMMTMNTNTESMWSRQNENSTEISVNVSDSLQTKTASQKCKREWNKILKKEQKLE